MTGRRRRIRVPPPKGTKLRGKKCHRITVVAPTGFEPVFQFSSSADRFARIFSNLPSPQSPNAVADAGRPQEAGDT
jgi:hypothetical protein